MKSIVFWVFLLVGYEVGAQTFQFRPFDFMNIQEQSVVYENAWTGGLALPAFQQIDVNSDGLEDLVTFDRLDNSVTTYIFDPSQNPPTYVPSLDYASLFPPISVFFDLIDYNGDGKKDLFTFSGGVVVAYKNIGTPGTPSFQLTGPWIPVFYPSFNFTVPMYASSADKPVVADVDGDGDIDVLVYLLGRAGQIQLYKNVSFERFGHRDSLVFIAADDCWGRFWSESDSVILMNDLCNIIMPSNRHHPEHVQFNISATDANKDGLVDLVMGDIASPFLRYLTNAGSSDSALIRAIQPRFPDYDSSAFIDGYPSAYFVDVNHDGRTDMLVSPSLYFGRASQEFVWHYENVSTSIQDSFRLRSKQFLLDKVWQNHLRAAPFMVDLNDDGQQDLILTHHSNDGTVKARLYLSVMQAGGQYHLVLVDTNFLNFGQFGIQYPQITSGDLNGDGRVDLVVGSLDGVIRFFPKLIGGAGFAFASPQSLLLNVDTAVAPELVDINRDGKLDLLVGTFRGKIMLFLNQGSATSPNFQLSNPAFGNINLSQSDPGWARPRVADFNGNGQYDLVVGGYEGKLHFYPDFEANLGGTFMESSNAFFFPLTGVYHQARFSFNTSPCVVAASAGQWPHLLIGTERGGVLAFRNTSQFSSVSPPILLDESVTVFPNPSASGYFQVAFSSKADIKVNSFSLSDIQGKQVKFEILSAADTGYGFFCERKGIFTLRMLLANGQYLVKKVVLLH